MSRAWQNYNGINTDNWFKTELIFGELSQPYTSYMSGGSFATQIRLYYTIYTTDGGWSPWYNIGWISPSTGGNSAYRNITQMNGTEPGDDPSVSTYVGNYVSFKWDSSNWSSLTDIPNDKYKVFEYAFEIYVNGVPVLQNVFANDNQSGFTGCGYFLNYYAPHCNISVVSVTPTTMTISRSGNSGFNTLSTFLWASYDASTYKYYNVNDLQGAISVGAAVYLQNASGSSVRSYPGFTTSGSNITITGIPSGSHQYVEAAATIPDGSYTIPYYVNVYTQLEQPTVSSISSTANSISWTFNTVPGATGYSVDLYLNGNWQSYTSGSSRSGSFTGLVSGTQYELRFYAYTSGSNPNSTTGNYYYSTTTLPRLSTPTISYSYNSRSITWTVQTVSNSNGYYSWVDSNSQFMDNNYPSQHTQDYLTQGTSHTLKAYAVGDGVNYRDSLTVTYNITITSLSTPSAPYSISFTQSAQTQYVVASWTKGSNTTHTDIDMSTDGSTWGSIDWPMQASNSYTLDTGYYGQHYFRLRPHNSDGYNDIVGSWTSSYGVVFVQGIVKKWNGSSWEVMVVKMWNGNSWVSALPKKWNGSSWV